LSACVLFGALPVDELYPQHGGHGGGGRQEVDLLVAEPELRGVARGEVAEAILVLHPVLVEVLAAVASLWAGRRGQCRRGKG